MKFPVFSLHNRELAFRDEFAPDCFLQRRVHCEPVRFDLSNTRMCGSIPRSWTSQFGSDPQQTDRCGSATVIGNPVVLG